MFKRIIVPLSIVLIASSATANQGQGPSSFDVENYSGSPPIPEKKPDLRELYHYCTSAGCRYSTVPLDINELENKFLNPEKPKTQSDSAGNSEIDKQKILGVLVNIGLAYFKKGCNQLSRGACQAAPKALEKGEKTMTYDKSVIWQRSAGNKEQYVKDCLAMKITNC